MHEKRLGWMGWLARLVCVGAAVNLMAFALILWLIKPFWTPVNSSLEQMLGHRFPWVEALICVGSLLAVACLRGLRRASRGVRFALPLAIFAALGADTLLYQLAQGLEKDQQILPLSAVECAPYVALAAVLALLILVLPRFQWWQSRRVRTTFFLVALGLVAVWIYKPWPPRIVAGPWLEFAGDEGLVVGWITDRPTAGWVEYSGQRKQTFRFGQNDADSCLHRVTLKNLPPGASITYRVVSRDTRAIEPYSARLGPERVSAPHTFTVPNPNAEQLSFLLFSDVHERFELLPDLMKAANTKPALVVLNGDTLFQAMSEYQTLRFLRTVSEQFAGEIPFAFVRGNHDSAGPFARQLPRYVGFGNGSFVDAVRMGPAALLFLDIGDPTFDKTGDYAQLVDEEGWNQEQAGLIEQLTDSEAWRSASFRIVCSHTDCGPQSATALQQKNVDLELVGHMHGTRYGVSGYGCPQLTASGDSWFEPENYPAYAVEVTRQQIAIKKVLKNGTVAEHWEIPARK